MKLMDALSQIDNGAQVRHATWEDGKILFKGVGNDYNKPKMGFYVKYADGRNVEPFKYTQNDLWKEGWEVVGLKTDAVEINPTAARLASMTALAKEIQKAYCDNICIQDNNNHSVACLSFQQCIKSIEKNQ